MIDLRLATQYTLECLHAETGSFGAGADARVKKFIEDPQAADAIEFGYVSGLSLSRFYIDPNKPNNTEEQSLWCVLQHKFGKPTAVLPISITSKTSVRTLRNLINEAAA